MKEGYRPKSETWLRGEGAIIPTRKRNNLRKLLCAEDFRALIYCLLFHEAQNRSISARLPSSEGERPSVDVLRFEKKAFTRI
jgi:hypothetical protein